MKKKSKILSIVLLVLLAVIIYIPLSCNSSCHSKSVEAPVEQAPVVEPVQETVKPAPEPKTEPEPEPVVQPVKQEAKPEPVVEPEPEPEPVKEPEPIPEPEPEPVPEPEPEPEPVVEKKPEPKPEPIPEPEPEVEVDEEEYKRSTKSLSRNGETVSRNEFNEDKNTILNTIKELQEIMNKKDFNSWLKYIAPESKDFYSKPRKVRNGNNIVIINGLKDYFLKLFIPARKQSQVKEIRYISKTSVKAVDIPSPGKITTYYNFVKVDGKWYVELPTNIVIK